jgi:cyclic 2,3-diphosphoglycerate synthetase
VEDALLAGVTAIGCRRCGAASRADVVHSTVAAGAALAAERRTALTIFEGSGASLPPVTAGRTLLVTSGRGRSAEGAGLSRALPAARRRRRVVVGDERKPALEGGIRDLRPGIPVMACTLVPGRRPRSRAAAWAVFTTAGAARTRRCGARLAGREGADVAWCPGALADRSALRAALAQTDADVFVTELKAAAVDVVAEARRPAAPSSCSWRTSRSRWTVGGRGRAARRARRAATENRFVTRVPAHVFYAPTVPSRQCLVVSGDRAFPYSKGLMAQSLMACGIAPDRAYRIARIVEIELRRGDEAYVTTTELREVAAAVLQREEGDEAVSRYRRWLRAAPPRAAADRADRRRPGHGQVDDRDPGRASARHHADRLIRRRAPGDAGRDRGGGAAARSTRPSFEAAE